MANFLFSTLPASGHINPILMVAARLVERGHQVWWHTHEDVAEKITAVGARFVPWRHTTQLTCDLEDLGGRAAANAVVINLLVAPTRGQVQDYREILQVFSADVLVTDMCCMGAMLLNELGGPPWATIGVTPLTTPSPDVPPWGMVLPPTPTLVDRMRNHVIHWVTGHVLLRGVTEALNRERRQAGGRPLPWGRTIFDSSISPYLHLQSTCASFEYPRRDMPPQVHFVGPLLPKAAADFRPPPWWSDLDGDRPVVFVTQGTVATNADELIVPTLRALAGEEVLVVATTAEPVDLGPLPANARVEPFIPYGALMPHVDVMVTNGGYNGVQTAFSYGVPLVVAGHTEDKPDVCARVAWTGAGINLRTGLPTPTQIAEAVRTVLRDPSYQRHAMQLQAEIAGHDGQTESAQLLEHLANTRRAVAAPAEHISLHPA